MDWYDKECVVSNHLPSPKLTASPKIGGFICQGLCGFASWRECIPSFVPTQFIPSISKHHCVFVSLGFPIHYPPKCLPNYYTVDGRNPKQPPGMYNYSSLPRVRSLCHYWLRKFRVEPPGMFKTLQITGDLPHQLVFAGFFPSTVSLYMLSSSTKETFVDPDTNDQQCYTASTYQPGSSAESIHHVVVKSNADTCIHNEYCI